MDLYIKKLVSITIIVVSLLFLVTGTQAQTRRGHRPRWDWQKHQRETIARAKKYLVSKIEPGLPEMSFADWFQAALDPDAQIDWEINDCGEQTGTWEDRGRDFPMCIEAKSQRTDNFFISVNIQFGRFGRGITGMTPVVRSITVGPEMGGEWLDNLSDLPGKIDAVKSKYAALDPNNGEFWISGDAPAAFKDLSMSFRTMDWNAQNKYVPVTRSGSISLDSRTFRMRDIIIDGDTLSFNTVTNRGVRFTFEGKLSLPTDASEEIAFGQRTLRGRLTKLVKGAPAAEADLIFDHSYSWDCQ